MEDKTKQFIDSVNKYDSHEISRYSKQRLDAGLMEKPMFVRLSDFVKIVNKLCMEIEILKQSKNESL